MEKIHTRARASFTFPMTTLWKLIHYVSPISSKCYILLWIQLQIKRKRQLWFSFHVDALLHNNSRIVNKIYTHLNARLVYPYFNEIKILCIILLRLTSICKRYFMVSNFKFFNKNLYKLEIMNYFSPNYVCIIINVHAHYHNCRYKI